jgi:hypothetical protein
MNLLTAKRFNVLKFIRLKTLLTQTIIVYEVSSEWNGKVATDKNSKL